MDNREVVLTLIDNQRIAEAYEIVQSLPAADAESWYLKGKVYSKMGQMNDALSCFNKAVAINPEHGEAMAMIELYNEIFSFKDPNLINP